MNKAAIHFAALTILTVAIAACGPSPEEVAEKTAAAATDTPAPTHTPEPTATPTPVPYDLSLSVRDESGEPIAEATVSLDLLDAVFTTDSDGRVEWNGLDEGEVNLALDAQGYSARETTMSLEPGSNEASISLERAPNEILSAQACLDGESFLYSEDFEDGTASEWHVEYGWRVAPDPTNPDDNVFFGQVPPDNPEPIAATAIGLGDIDNAIWRSWFYRTDGTVNYSFHNAGVAYVDADEDEVINGNYNLFITPGGPSELRAWETGHNDDPLYRDLALAYGGPFPKYEDWHYLEMMATGGLVQIWIDGNPFIKIEDPRPIPLNGMGIVLNVPGGDTEPFMLVDDVTVCQTEGEFQSAYPFIEQEATEGG